MNRVTQPSCFCARWKRYASRVCEPLKNFTHAPLSFSLTPSLFFSSRELSPPRRSRQIHRLCLLLAIELDIIRITYRLRCQIILTPMPCFASTVCNISFCFALQARDRRVTRLFLAVFMAIGPFVPALLREREEYLIRNLIRIVVMSVCWWNPYFSPAERAYKICTLNKICANMLYKRKCICKII